MDDFQQFLTNFDLQALWTLALRVAAVLLCITVHELCHGLAARWLGDRTASNAGRISLNPLRHIDPLGFLMMVFVGVGWAKPVPVDARNFRHPKSGMALTALAGPVSNFLLALFALGAASGMLRLFPQFSAGSDAGYMLLLFLVRVSVLSIGLGLFNLVPFPPLDGSKVLFALLPQRIYFQVLRYERYLSLLLVAVLFLGFLDQPLNLAIRWVLKGICAVTRFPGGLLGLS